MQFRLRPNDGHVSHVDPLLSLLFNTRELSEFLFIIFILGPEVLHMQMIDGVKYLQISGQKLLTGKAPALSNIVECSSARGNILA